MKGINKIGLALIRSGALLLVRNKNTSKFIIPGGRTEKNETDIDTLKREISEELSCDLNIKGIKYIDEYEDIAANDPSSIVNIRLYLGEIEGELISSNEIEEFIWFNPVVDDWSILSDIIKNKIIPDLMGKKLI